MKQEVTEMVKKLSLNDMEWPGLVFSDAKEAQDPSRQTDTAYPIEDIPGISNIPFLHSEKNWFWMEWIGLSRWTVDEYKELRKPKEKSLFSRLESVLDMLVKHKSVRVSLFYGPSFRIELDSRNSLGHFWSQFKLNKSQTTTK